MHLAWSRHLHRAGISLPRITPLRPGPGPKHRRVGNRRIECNYPRPKLASPQPMDVTHNGEHKRMFDLVDVSGAWIRCCAIKKNACSRALADGNEVILFFAHARPSSNAQ